jgi:cyclic lactone autoinducer peptide
MFVLVVAQVASTRFSVIFYQDEIPEKVKTLRKTG